MPKRPSPLKPLRDEQLLASSPEDHAALSASAGTGKTHVLTARVLRLLLAGVDPASILCLTFTKAGAAEMSQRIHERLAYWVRLKGADVSADLKALGEDHGPPTQERARTLFAEVLEATGGGLRIQTIHAFAQSLLAAFPAEAGLTPGFCPMEGREEQLLARAALADLLVRAEAGGDQGLVRDMQALSHRLGEGGAEAFMMACARAPDALAELGPREGIEARLRRAFGLPSGNIEEAIEAECCDDRFDLATLEAVAAANRAWGTATGLKSCDAIAAWLARGSGDRSLALDELAQVVLTKGLEPRSITAGLAKAAPDYADHAQKLADCCLRLLRMRSTARLVGCFAAGLRAGQSFAIAYADAKRAAGVADFDDLIRWAERLLLQPGMGDWVRYKLDQRTDHILVDEAQDTNEAQWNIVRALTEEFLAGDDMLGRHRTIFTVGDFKQAIFGFQGTNPREFEKAREYFSESAHRLRQAAEEVGHAALPPRFRDLSMDQSFRSSPPILRAVDRLIAEVGHEALGLPRRPNPHATTHQARPGSVTLWKPFISEAPEAEGEEAGEEGWIGDATRRYAGKLARQVRDWLTFPFDVGEGAKRRPLRPEDILILVRRRSDLASLIVARLYAEGVPVAGVDRLRLSAPLAVQDLLAAARFAIQPLDDLNLASLLVSPLFGWHQDELYAAAYGREGALWPRVRDSRAGEGLQSLLAMADYVTPHQFFETILSGPLDGRRGLLRRLGEEALDPINELLASALEFEARGAVSLQRFLDWFARGDVDIVRDPSAPLDAVRVMTVHGSKGLQAPVVILADACVDPERSRREFASFRLPNGPCIPLFRPKKDELVEPLRAQVEEKDRSEREEHWRLLYVALTRAEERLYIGGALGPADKAGAPKSSWHRAVEAALGGLGCGWQEDAGWGAAMHFGDPLTRGPRVPQRATERNAAMPSWLGEPAPVEARPPRPLAPSALEEDKVPNPPPSAGMRSAAERGRLLHRLLERLPDLPEAERRAAADAWLAQSAGVRDETLRTEIADRACGIIADPRFADLFSPTALAEAPIAAVLPDGNVVAGTVDRLLVEPDRILLVDFKTGRAVPSGLDDLPRAHLNQIGAYAAALEVILPGRRIEAGLLYTSGPVLHALPSHLLDRHRPPQPA